VRRKALLLASSIALSVALLELSLVLLDLTPQVYAPRRVEPQESFFDRLEDGLYVYRPGVRFAHVYDPAGAPDDYLGKDGRVQYRINRHGTRGADFKLARRPGVARVLLLGDSFTFGEGVREEDTFAVRLHTLLAASRAVEVINGGVQGYATEHEARWLAHRGLAMRPDVVVLGFVLNDVIAWSDTVAQQEASTSAWTPPPWARPSRALTALARVMHVREVQDRFYGQIRHGFGSQRWKRGQHLLTQLCQLGGQRGYRFVALVFPLFVDLDGDYPFADLHREVTRTVTSAGCEAVDLLDAFRGQSATPLRVHATDQHPSHLAHARVARELAPVVARLLSSETPPPAAPAPATDRASEAGQ